MIRFFDADGADSSSGARLRHFGRDSQVPTLDSVRVSRHSCSEIFVYDDTVA